MSLDKAIKYGKEHRKPYTGSEAIFTSCRHHGGCLWCEENRRHKFRDKHPRDIRKEISAGGDACIIPGFLCDEVMS